jgi:hypothetical protein
MTDKLKSSVRLTKKVCGRRSDTTSATKIRHVLHVPTGRAKQQQAKQDVTGENVVFQTWTRRLTRRSAVELLRGGDLWICSSRAIFFGAGALPNTPLLAFPAMQAGWNFLHSVSLGNSLFTLPNISGLHSRSLD